MIAEIAFGIAKEDNLIEIRAYPPGEILNSGHIFLELIPEKEIAWIRGIKTYSQRTGFARELLKYTENLMKEYGIKILYLTPRNVCMAGFWLHMGFSFVDSDEKEMFREVK